jgi:hypothetical protein
MEKGPGKTKELALLELTQAGAEKARKDGVPVLDNFRIDASAFESVYGRSEITKDAEKIEKLKQKMRSRGDMPPEEKEMLMGEKLEVLKTVIFNKFLEEDFVVSRSSEYDDMINGVDNIIADRNSGNVVCAFDEVSLIKGGDFEAKKIKILMKNSRESGATLKYGFSIKRDKDGKQNITLGEIPHLPMFCLSLPENLIEEGVEKTAVEGQENESFQKNLFSYFRSSLENQISLLKLHRHADKDFKQRLKVFEELLKKY